MHPYPRSESRHNGGCDNPEMPSRERPKPSGSSALASGPPEGRGAGTRVPVRGSAPNDLMRRSKKGVDAHWRTSRAPPRKRAVASSDRRSSTLLLLFVGTTSAPRFDRVLRPGARRRGRSPPLPSTSGVGPFMDPGELLHSVLAHFRPLRRGRDRHGSMGPAPSIRPHGLARRDRPGSGVRQGDAMALHQ